MAQDMRPGAVMFSPRQPTFVINILLLLIVIGLGIIILLMLFWFPTYGWWGGAKVIGADGRTLTGGGGVVINAACCDTGCPPGTPPPTTNTCEDTCRQRYAKYPDVLKNCIEAECGRDPCEQSCWKRYMTSTAAYDSCVRQECGTPQTPPTTPPTTPPGCVDSDGSDTSTAGSVTYNGQVFTDDCADKMRVGEWICRNGKPDRVVMTCPRECVRGMCAPTGVTALV